MPVLPVLIFFRTGEFNEKGKKSSKRTSEEELVDSSTEWLAVRDAMSLNELYPESKRRIHELELLLFEYERDNTHFTITDISLMMQNLYSLTHLVSYLLSYLLTH